MIELRERIFGGERRNGCINKQGWGWGGGVKNDCGIKKGNVVEIIGMVL